MRKAIIFGINGQDGYYLERILTADGIEVTGVSRSGENWLKGDVGDRDFIGQLIRELKPDFIFHLAAHSRINHELLFEHQRTIADGTLHILESVYQHSKESRVFITGSGLQFRNTGEPISERSPFEARDAYSLARIQSVYVARYYRTLGIKTYVGYLFHHDSPLRGNSHLNKKIADAALAAGRGAAIPLSIGDVLVEKEFGFAGDIAGGIYHLVNQDHFSEACVGTGKAYAIEQWLELCFGLAGKNWKDYVTRQDNFLPGFRRMVSDPSLLQSSGWSARVSIEQLAEMMMKTPPTT
ncbi:MAG: GDP-mannose 4,6-dehydratase [Chitinophagaceae bacterium]